MPPERDGLTKHCSYEPARRPLDEFYEDSKHGWVHYKNVKELHTITGEVIKVHQIPGTALRIKDALDHDILEEIPEVGAIMKERFGVDNVDELRGKL